MNDTETKAAPDPVSSQSHVLLSSDAEIAAMRESAEVFGFGALNSSLPDEVLAQLRDEARQQLGGAKHAESGSESKLRYSASVASLGSHALDILTSRQMTGLLESVFSGHYNLSENISCYTFYTSNDHLGAHQDSPADQCSVTIIIYLHAVSPYSCAKDTGLVLNVYGETENSVGDVRLKIPTIAGSIVLGRGSVFWHERPRLLPGEEVTAITGCYARAK